MSLNNQAQHIKTEYNPVPQFTEPYSLDVSHVERDVQTESLINKIKANCEHTFQLLLELQERVNLPKKRVASTAARRIALLLSEEQRLANELDQQREELQMIDNKAPGLSWLQAQKKLNLTITGYQRALGLLKKEQEQIESKLLSERENKERYQRINTMLLGRLNDLKERKILTEKAKPLIPGVQEEFHRIRRLNARAMIELMKFVEKHFPPVSVYKGKIATNEERQLHGNAFSLKVLLEDLMNSAVTGLNDSYVKVNPDTCWEPYIELLIKGGIATRHPQDPNRLKLTEFRI